MVSPTLDTVEVSLEIHDIKPGPTIRYPYLVRRFENAFPLVLRASIYAWLEKRDMAHVTSQSGTLYFKRAEDRTLFLLQWVENK